MTRRSRGVVLAGLLVVMLSTGCGGDAGHPRHAVAPGLVDREVRSTYRLGGCATAAGATAVSADLLGVSNLSFLDLPEDPVSQPLPAGPYSASARVPGSTSHQSFGTYTIAQRTRITFRYRPENDGTDELAETFTMTIAAKQLVLQNDRLRCSFTRTASIGY